MPRQSPNRKWTAFALGYTALTGLDLWTKSWALRTLEWGTPRPGIGDWLPFTLSFNRGAAFSFSVGPASRYVFAGVSVVALVWLLHLYWTSRPTERVKRAAVILVASGASGNLWDRVRWDRGVVDFLGPVDLGFMTWPVFNVADCAISVGAGLLLISLYLEDRAAAKALAPD